MTAESESTVSVIQTPVQSSSVSSGVGGEKVPLISMRNAGGMRAPCRPRFPTRVDPQLRPEHQGPRAAPQGEAPESPA